MTIFWMSTVMLWSFPSEDARLEPGVLVLHRYSAQAVIDTDFLGS